MWTNILNDTDAKINKIKTIVQKFKSSQIGYLTAHVELNELGYTDQEIIKLLL